MIIFKGILTKYMPLASGEMSITLHTMTEVSPNDVMMVHGFHRKAVSVVIGDESVADLLNVGEKEIQGMVKKPPLVVDRPAAPPRGKKDGERFSPSQILRNRMFGYFNDHPMLMQQYNGFDDYYDHEMKAIIDDWTSKRYE